MDKNATILVVEDNADNLELMVDLLEAFGYSSLTASNGISGVKLAREARPDLIICDIHMPKLDGYGVVHELKSDPDLRRIPVLAVTALAMVGIRERIIAAGFDGYISKPIEPQDFVRQLETFLKPTGRKPNPQSPPAAVAECATRSPAATLGTILAVDDTAANNEFIRSTLEPFGYRVLTTDSVYEAIEIARKSLPDLILCDLSMRPKNGRDMLQLTSDDRHLVNIPIAIITSTPAFGSVARECLDAGAARFIRRPIEPRELLAEVGSLLRERAMAH